MAFGVGPSMGMGAMGRAAGNVAGKFTNQPAQTQPFGNMGPGAAQLMNGQGMPPLGQQGTLSGMQTPQGMQGSIGPSNFQELLRKYLTMGSGSSMQPMGGMNSQMGMQPGLGINSLYNG